MSYAKRRKRPANRPRLRKLVANYGGFAAALGVAVVAAPLFHCTAALAQELSQAFHEKRGLTYSVITANPTSNNLCAMVFVDDNSGETQECCGCPLAPTTSLVNPLANLTDNPAFNGGSFSTRNPAGTVYIYSAEPNYNGGRGQGFNANGDCAPGEAFTLAPGLRAWLETSRATRFPVEGLPSPFITKFKPTPVDPMFEYAESAVEASTSAPPDRRG